MTMSCTAPPAHRMRGFFLPCGSLKTDLVLYPCADDVMRDRYRRRRRQSLRVFAHQHAPDLFLAKPAGVLEFLAVDDDFVRQGLGMAADHQRRRERPGL